MLDQASRIVDYAVRDVANAKKEARYLIRIQEDSSLSVFENLSGKLSVIAVVGRGELFSQLFNEAVLLEVGVSRGRPYGETFSRVPRRYSLFSLIKDQYLLVAPLIFRIIEKIAVQKISRWKSKGGFYLPTSRHYWSRGQKQLFHSSRLKPQRKGIRFTAAVKDKFLVSDLYFAETVLNKQVERHIRGLAKFIDLRLSGYRNGYQRDFFKLKGARQIQEVIQNSSLPFHLLVKMMERLPGAANNCFQQEIAALIGWRGEQPSELCLAESTLEDPQKRLADIQLRIVRQKGNYVVFEVYPLEIGEDNHENNSQS